MKTKKLIELLQAEDPGGEGEVLVGNEDILCIDSVEGYWDGCKQVMVRDWSSEYYNIIGAEYRSDGSKVRIHTMGIYDALINDPDLPVKVVDTFVEKKMQKWVDDSRKEIKKMWKEVKGEKNGKDN